MRRFIVALGLAACVGCVHSKEVERGDQKEKAEQKKAPSQEGKKEEVRPPAEPGRPELTPSVEGLLLPEGPRLIQQALAEHGYLARDHQTGELDKETSAALRKFQAAEEMARTGYPDRETVRRLGLSVAKVFKATGEGNTDPHRK